MAATIQVIQSAASAEKLLKPERLRILELLAEPDSAAGLARRLKLPRQTVNYHVRELEKEGFVEFVEQRKKGNCMERVLRAAARCYVISPRAFGSLGVVAGEAADRFSEAYLVSAAMRAVRDVSTLRRRAGKTGKTLGTMTVETGIRFATARARLEFSEELVTLMVRLAAKYNDEKTEGGRSFRFLLGGYPAVVEQGDEDNASVRIE